MASIFGAERSNRRWMSGSRSVAVLRRSRRMGARSVFGNLEMWKFGNRVLSRRTDVDGLDGMLAAIVRDRTLECRARDRGGIWGPGAPVESRARWRRGSAAGEGFRVDDRRQAVPPLRDPHGHRCAVGLSARAAE